MRSLKNWWDKKNEKIAESLLNKDFQVGKIKSKHELWLIPGSIIITFIPTFYMYIRISDISKREEIIPYVLFWTFFGVGLFAFILSAVILPVFKIIQSCSIKKAIEDKISKKALKDEMRALKNKIKALEDKISKKALEDEMRALKNKIKALKDEINNHLATFLSPVPRQVMSMGVIPIIFGILGIIIFKHEPPEIFPGVDFLMFLIILGGMTEAIAFYFGFKYPEPGAPAEAGSVSDVEKLIDTTNKLGAAMKDLQSKIPTKATVEIDKTSLTIKFY